jgi:hypothetical protein
MPLIFAEYCGRWGCTWWEGIITLIIMNFPAFAFLFFWFIVLLLLGVLKAVDFITNFGKPKQEIKNTNKPQEENKRVLLAIKLLGRAVKKQLDNRRNKHESEQ